MKSYVMSEMISGPSILLWGAPNSIVELALTLKLRALIRNKLWGNDLPSLKFNYKSLRIKIQMYHFKIRLQIFTY